MNDYIYNLYKGKTDLGANYDAFMFIFEKDAYSAIANAIDNANSLIDTYVSSSDDEEEYENITYTARTVPEKEEEEEDDAELLKGYKEKFIDFSGERSTAFIKVKDRLANLYLIGSEENVDLKETKYILAYSYFTSLVKSSAEAAIVAVYEQALKNMAGIDYTTATAGEKNNLWEQYVALQNKQKAQYTGDISSFETQLSAVGDSSFVAYVPSAGYFYVSHLLIGYTDEQKALVETITSQQGKTEEEIQEEINALAESMVIEDQRASWVLSNYGTYDGQTFRFSDKYLYDADGDLAVFKGTIGGAKAYTAKDDEGNDVNKFSFSNVVADKLTYGEFIGFATKAITGEEGDLVLDTVFGGSDAKRIDKEAFNRFEDLKFAFSTDTGNFNNYLGYAYSPITSKSQYVSAFYKACEKIGKEENKVGAYVMFMSQEYGLHIVLCTATADFGVYENTVDGKAAFEADLEDEESVAYLFMKAQLDLVSSSYINDIAQSFISEYTAEGAKIAGTSDLIVTYYEKAYNDLITE